MAGSKTIQINLKAVADFNDVVNNAKQIQSVLEKLKLPDSLKANFTKIFADIDKNATKAAEAMERGFKTKGDVSTFEKTVNSINSSMTKLTQNMQKIDSESFGFGSLTGEINELDKTIKRLQNELNAISAQKLQDVTNAVKEGQKISKAGAWEEFFNAFKEGTAGVEDAQKAYNKLAGEVEKAKQRLGEEEFLKSEKWQNYARQVGVLGIALKDLNGTSQQTIEKKQELDAAYGKQEALKLEGAKEGQQNLDNLNNSQKRFVEEFNKMAGAATNSAQAMQQTNSTLDHFKQRITYFFGAANAVNLFKRAIRSAFNTIKDLDKVMTETAVVTKFDVSDMWDQLPEYTKRANELGVSIHSAYESATIYYQQGLKTNEVIALSNQTLKMARIAGLDAAEATDRMTNALRGFNMELNETNAERVADVYSKLAAMSASNVDEISTAMTKVASLASNANMQFETTAAFLSQIIETTRESAETAGTALKTVVARFSEVKKLFSEGELLGTDEEGEAIDVNKVSVALRTAGINLNEYLTGMKGLDDIFLELASEWNSLDKVQQRYIATMAAGSRQQSRFIAMMQDYGRTQELVNAANNAAGASNEQYQKTLDSLESKLARLKNAWDQFLMGITNNQIVKGVVDALTDFLNILNKITADLPGFLKSVANIGIVFAGLKIGKAIFNKAFASLGNTFMNGGRQAADGLSKGIQQNMPKVSAVARSYAKQISNDFSKSLQLGKNITFEELIAKIRQMPSKVQQELIAASPALQLAIRNTVENALDKGVQSGEIAQKDADEYVKTFMATLTAKGGDITKAINSISAKAPGFKTTLLKTEVTTQDIQNLQTSFSELGTTVGKVSGAFYNFASILDGIGLSGAANAVRKVGAAFSALGGIVTSVGSIMISMGIKVQSAWFLVIAIIAAVAAIAVGLYLIFRKSESEAEKLAKQTEAAKESAQKAKEAYDDLLSMKETHDRLLEELNELQKGTVEWYNKLKEVNDQVMALLNNAPELSKFLSVGENGILTIDQEGWNEYIANQNKMTRELEANALLLESRQASKTSNINYEEGANKLFNKYHDSTSYVYRTTGGAETGAVVKASEEDFMAFTKDFYENPQNYLNNGKYTEVDQLPEMLQKDPLAKNYNIDWLNKFIESYKIGDEWAVGLIQGYADLIGEQAESATKSQSAFSQALYARFSATDTSMSEYFNEIVGGITDTLTDDMLQMYEKEVEKRAGKDPKEEYRKAFDLTEEELNKKIEEDDDLTPDAMISELAAKEVQEYYAQIIENSVKSGKEIAALLNPEKALNFNQEEAKALEINGENILKEAGFNPNEIKEILENYRIAEQDIIDQIQENMNSLNWNGSNKDWWYNSNKLTLGTKRSITEQGLKMQDLGGSESVDSFNRIIGIFSRKLPTQDFEKFAQAISKLDLTNYDDIKKLSNYLEAFGIDASEFGIDIDNIEDRLISAAHAAKIFSMDNVKEQLKTTMDLAEETRGRSSYRFSDEEVQKYIAQGISASDFEFNGQDWVYVGGTMETLAAAVEANTSAIIEDTKAQLQRQVESGNQLAQIANNKNLPVNSEALLNGEFNISAFRGLLELNKQTSITNPLNGETFDLSTITDTMLETIYRQMVSDYQNLDFNTAKLESYDSDLGRTTNTVDAGQAIKQGEQAGLNSTEIVEYANQLQILTDQQEETQKLSHDMATEISKDNLIMVNSISELASNWETWQKGLSADRGSAKYSESLNAVRKNMQGLLGITGNLSENFITNENTMELMSRAAQNDTEAIEELRKAAAADIYVHAGLKLNEESLGEFNSLIDQLTSEDYVIGTTLDNSDVINGLYDTMVEAGATTQQIQDMFDSLGWEPQFETEEYTLSDADIRQGYVEVVADPIKGTTRKIPIESGMKAGATMSIPKIRGKDSNISATYRGKSKVAIDTKPPSSSGGGGGGGGSSKEEKPSYWENPYDELYNLTEKINEAMRTREALEREYGKLLEERTTSTKQILQNSLDEIALLRQQLDYEKQMEAGRKRQVENIGSQMYTDDEGNRTAFSELGVMKYASYDFKTGLIQIDWSGLEEIANDASREEEGKQAEAYISKLEELVGQYEDVRDAVWEIEDKLEEIRKRSIDESIEFQQRIFDAIVSQKQAIIDSFDAMSQAIEETTSKVIDNVREQIQAERQQRQNEKTEEEISDKEARLAYLSRDTSGANQLETMKLQKEIDDARQNYSDSLIDQAIDQMQKDADLAAEQRAQQIQIMQAQLDIATENGEFWSDVKALLDDAFNPDGTLKEGSKLVQLLKDTEAFKGMSEMGQDQWINDMVEAWLTANEGLSNWKMKKAEEAGSLTLGNGTKLTYKDGKWTDGKNTYSDVGYDVQSGQFVGTNNKDYKPAQPSGGGKAGTGGGQPAKQEPTQAEVTDAIKRGVSAAVWNGNQGWDPDRSKKLKEVFGNGSVYSDIINYINAGVYSGDPSAFSYANMKKKNFKKYESGGLASYTGLAWLDGSRAKPEAILSAQDTKNFIALRDILAQFMGSGAVGGGSKSGDNYFDIDIQAEIGSDYDVDRLASQIKQQIYNDSTYRNVNAINYIR